MMKFLTSIVAAVAFAALVGCETPARLSDNRYFPKEPAFSIEPEPIAESSGLDFDAVYYLAHVTIPGVLPHGGGSYYRFWPSGRVLITATRTDGPPSADEADAFRTARLGYYRERKNRLDMEFYVPDPGMGWSYERVNAFIDENGDIVETWSKVGHRVRQHRYVFLKEHLEGMKRKPDW